MALSDGPPQQCQATEVAPSGFSGQAARQPLLLQPGENALPDGGEGHGARGSLEAPEPPHH